MPSVLLIAPESAAVPLAEALRNELGIEVESVTSVREALAACLRRREFALVLLDESFAFSADPIYQAPGAAPLLELNVAISSAARIVRQVRAALARRDLMIAEARSAAAHSLRDELNATLAGLLLESQLALRHATPESAPHLQHLVELAGQLRAVLHT
jgi:CheY-like chemotaxis protein